MIIIHSAVIVAIMKSETYSWVALGNTKTEAMNAIVEEWNDGNRLRKNVTLEELIKWYEIRTYKLKPGECYVE